MSKKIDSTSFDIQNTWLNDIAPKYFDVNDISMLRLGLFGYVNEITSNGIEDSINMSNIISNEIYPNKALLPNSVYAYASLGNFSDFNAVPAKVNFTLAIRMDDLYENATFSNDKSFKIFKLSRNSILTVDSTKKFMLNYDITLKIKKNNKTRTSTESGYYLSAYYNTDSLRNGIESIQSNTDSTENPYILTKQMNLSNENSNEGDWYIFLYLEASQVERTEYNFDVMNEDLVSSLKYDIEYSGNIAGFNIWYYPPDSTNEENPIQIDKYYVDSIKPESDYFCFYEYSDSKTLSILFNAHPDYFKPSYNSHLKIEIYTTDGEDGNFVYEGNNIEFAFSLDDSNNYSSKILHYAFLSGNSTGGKDAMSIDEIKYNAIKAFSVRKNIISDNDLNYYFEGITNNSKMKFIKKRDDLIRRIYSAFLLLRNAKNEIIPTNTVNLFMENKDFDNYFIDSSGRENIPDTLMYKAGKIIEYDKVLDNWEYFKSTNDITLDDIIKNEKVGKYYYTNPFLMKVNSSPYFISYYMNSVYDTYNLIFKDINNDIMDEFVMTSLEIKRNALAKDNSDTYYIDVNINMNSSGDSIFVLDSNSNIILPPSNFRYKESIVENGEKFYVFTWDENDYGRYSIYVNDMEVITDIRENECKLNDSLFKEDGIYSIAVVSINEEDITSSKSVYDFQKGDSTKRIKELSNTNYEMKVLFFIKDSDDNYLGFFDGIPKRKSSDGLFVEVEAEIKTSDFINSSDSISIINSIYELGTPSRIIKEECPVPSDNIYLEVGIFLKGVVSDNTVNPSYITSKYYCDKHGITLPNEFNEYCLCNVFETADEIKLFKDINNIENSTLVLNDLSSYKVKSVPVVRYDYLQNEDNFKEFITLLDYFRNSLQSTLTVIENNFDIDMKFYNTYGESKYFVLGRKGEKLEGSNISLNLTIKLNQDLTEVIKNDINDYIIEFIESLNNTDSVNYLYISDLIQGLTNEFDYITYIEFNGFNERDSSLQIIENQYTDLTELPKEQIIKYVPEYLNINKVASYDDNGILKFTPEINIEYV